MPDDPQLDANDSSLWWLRQPGGPLHITVHPYAPSDTQPNNPIATNGVVSGSPPATQPDDGYPDDWVPEWTPARDALYPDDWTPPWTPARDALYPDDWIPASGSASSNERRAPQVQAAAPSAAASRPPASSSAASSATWPRPTARPPSVPSAAQTGAMAWLPAISPNDWSFGPVADVAATSPLSGSPPIPDGQSLLSGLAQLGKPASGILPDGFAAAPSSGLFPFIPPEDHYNSGLRVVPPVPANSKLSFANRIVNGVAGALSIAQAPRPARDMYVRLIPGLADSPSSATPSWNRLAVGPSQSEDFSHLVQRVADPEEELEGHTPKFELGGPEPSWALSPFGNSGHSHYLPRGFGAGFPIAPRSSPARSAAGPGAWKAVNESMSPSAAAYQTRITGRTGQAYEVNGVRFDGFTAAEGLIEAKGPGYATFVENGEFKSYFNGAKDLVYQAKRQRDVANGEPITWHVAEPEAAMAIQRLLDSAGIKEIRVVHTPAGP